MSNVQPWVTPLILSRQTTCRLRAMLPFVIQISALGSTHSIPGASFTLTLQRRPQYYMLNIIIPTIVLAALSALNFAVPVDSGEKLSLGISILLAFSVFMLILQDNTPQADTPVLGEYTRVQWTVVDMLIYPSEKNDCVRTPGGCVLHPAPKAARHRYEKLIIIGHCHFNSSMSRDANIRQ